MTNAKHTPGPWNGDVTVHICGCYEAGLNIGWLQTQKAERRAEGEANARLIAAAPDLYEALANLENDSGQIPDHAWKMVQAALAKARGES
jgi:hypothetical protein